MSKNEYEIRYTSGLTVEKRDDKPSVITGYAIVFNSLSHDLGNFREIILPQAVDRTLSSNADIRAFVEHDSKNKLGRKKANTLRLQKDERGVKVEIDIPNTQLGRDIQEGLSRGDYDGMSFRFAVVKDKWEKQDNSWLRSIEDMQFDEVSIVGDPAYPDTSVALRSLNNAVKESGIEIDRDLQRAMNLLKLLDI